MYVAEIRTSDPQEKKAFKQRRLNTAISLNFLLYVLSGFDWNKYRYILFHFKFFMVQSIFIVKILKYIMSSHQLLLSYLGQIITRICKSQSHCNIIKSSRSEIGSNNLPNGGSFPLAVYWIGVSGLLQLSSPNWIAGERERDVSHNFLYRCIMKQAANNMARVNK